jgi:hypothetical protein
MVAAGAGNGAGATTPNNNNLNNPGSGAYDGAGADQLTSIGEDELEEHNPLAIVPDSGRPFATPGTSRGNSGSSRPARLDLEVVPAAGPPVEAKQVRKEEVETKVSAWQTSEVAQINNRFKREEVVINGWETEQVDKACAWLKKIEVVLQMNKHSFCFILSSAVYFIIEISLNNSTCFELNLHLLIITAWNLVSSNRQNHQT